MDYTPLHTWDVSTGQARDLQLELRDRLSFEPPSDFQPGRIAGADLSWERKATHGYAGIAVINTETMETVEEASATAPLTFPYVPGLLSFRELPPITAAWERIEERPDAIIFDAHGYAHPRRMGLACHGGLLFDLPSVGCAKSVLVGEHEPVGEERGNSAPLVADGEVIGMALRTRDRVRPVYVSIGHRVDLATAVKLVLEVGGGYREPETTRRSHKLANRRRRHAS